jgi:hypothetical protein
VDSQAEVHANGQADISQTRSLAGGLASGYGQVQRHEEGQAYRQTRRLHGEVFQIGKWVDRFKDLQRDADRQTSRQHGEVFQIGR